MKLWWPHSEAMIALLMGYSDSGDPALLHLFYQVAEYTFRQVSAASWSTALDGLGKGVGDTVGSHSPLGSGRRLVQGEGGSSCRERVAHPTLCFIECCPSADLRVPGGPPQCPLFSQQSSPCSPGAHVSVGRGDSGGDGLYRVVSLSDLGIAGFRKRLWGTEPEAVAVILASEGGGPGLGWEMQWTDDHSLVNWGSLGHDCLDVII